MWYDGSCRTYSMLATVVANEKRGEPDYKIGVCFYVEHRRWYILNRLLQCYLQSNPYFDVHQNVSVSKQFENIIFSFIWQNIITNLLPCMGNNHFIGRFLYSIGTGSGVCRSITTQKKKTITRLGKRKS